MRRQLPKNHRLYGQTLLTVGGYEVMADFGAITYQFTTNVEASDRPLHPETPAMPYDRVLATDLICLIQ